MHIGIYIDNLLKVIRIYSGSSHLHSHDVRVVCLRSDPHTERRIYAYRFCMRDEVRMEGGMDVVVGLWKHACIISSSRHLMWAHVAAYVIPMHACDPAPRSYLSTQGSDAETGACGGH